MNPFTNPFPFRNPETRSSIGEVISAITNGEAVEESHSRAALEKLSITRLRELQKKYEAAVLKGDRTASEELATVRGLLRAKGAGSTVDEGVLHEGGVKAALHDFMEGLPAGAVKALRPVMGDSSIRGGTLRARVGAILKKNGVPSMVLGGSSAQIVIDNWDTFHGGVNEARLVGGADYLQAAKNALSGKGFKTNREVKYAGVNANMAALRAANAADLKDKPGAAGEKAHKRLHKTIGKVLKGK